MTPQHYPLTWPAFRPRTPHYRRKPGAFKASGKAITLSTAAERLQTEVERLGGKNLVLSTNVEPTLSGRPRSGQAKPRDPGVAVYFQLSGESIVLACDTFADVAQNIAGLAAHIDAIRKVERYGVQKAAEALRAFQALPPPAASARPWREVMEFSEFRNPDAAEIRTRYRILAPTRHPDTGGSAEAMAELNAARDQALRELGVMS